MIEMGNVTMNAKKILVVENAHTLSLYISLNLQVRGHEVFVTDSLTSARNDIERFTPDLIILDLYLDDGHGAELLKELCAKGKHIPVVVVTGAIIEHEIGQSFSNVIGTLQKPFGLNQLLAVIP
jgi:two-component system, OmpR family, response regulator